MKGELKKKEQEERERRRQLYRGPDLDKYASEKKKNYISYAEGARRYSMNYYTFVTLCKRSKANIRIRKSVVVDTDILDAYIEENCKGEGDGTDE